MSTKKKTWQQKLADSKDLPRITRVHGAMSRRWGIGRMVIPAPRDVDALMKRVPKGRVTTINQLRLALAGQHHADFACPLTTGIFAWIAAHAAAEAERGGAKRITPYWRTLKDRGELNPKFPGGVKAIARRLRAEGHGIIQKGKRFFVADYQDVLFGRLA